MEYITPDATQGVILCCECGVQIQPNPTSRCLACIRATNDISENIPKQSILYFCRGCERYLDPPQAWIHAALESKELLRICLKKLKNLNKVRLVDAGFAWTEPHSKRIKVKLAIQKEIEAGAVLQQECIVEFVINHFMCTDCHRIEAKDYWKAMVQANLCTNLQRTFFYLEQLMIKHKAHANTLGIKAVNGGLDFFYANEQGARHMVDFLTSVVPTKWTHSKKLISHDVHSNTYNYKYTYSVELVPICKDSVVCLPSKLAHQLGGIGQISVVHRVTNHISLIDPNTGQLAEIPANVFWRTPFQSLVTSKKLKEFIVMEMSDAQVRHFKGQGQISTKHVVSEVWVQRTCDLGTDDMIFCRTHLGHLLSIGDTVLGIDIRTSNINNEDFEKINKDSVPDVILVKKVYADKTLRNRKRRFKLRHLGIDDDNTSQNKDYTDFLEDLEEDETIRQNVNLYRDETKLAASAADTASEAGDVPTVSLEEMLEDLVIGEDATGGDGAPMMD
ncbi:unnamed protein product, partial [Meganyctiphanes norvegica]